MYAPSVDARSFHSELALHQLFTNRTPGTFIASRLIASRSSALSSSGILNGSFVSAVCHTSTWAASGASATGRFSRAAFAFATATAAAATRSPSAAVTTGVAENPHAPPAITRTPTPYSSFDATLSIRSSRAPRRSLRIRTIRTSA